ncbi:transcription factor Opi1-domain-containing protein [Pyronema omphalodes]|nr:transcription factor Opi1-domain-containing protein [Pyronema omphalodes]
MATRTRYKSASPGPTSNILSKDMFPSAPPRPDPPQRYSELPILNYHNARPTADNKIQLPPASSIASPPHTPVLAAKTVSPERDDRDREILPFGWEREQRRPRQNGLSIQSLISSPGTEERGMKRKGSDISDRDDDRSSRGTSVVSTTKLSMEDPDVRDAVEALGGLKADFAHAASPPAKPEPLINLIHNSASSVHPLLSTALSGSTAIYTASKTYIRPFRYVAESAESITAPVVRRSGLEGYIRRGLENKRRKAEASSASTAAQIPPPAQNQELVRKPPAWHSRLYYSSTGLATALSDESRRSLRYCLRILFAANSNLVKVIETLSNVVDELDNYLNARPPVAGYLPEPYEARRQRLADTVDRLKDEALKTLKQVVDTISRYAGGALPEQARNVVKRQLLSFPIRMHVQTTAVQGEEDEGKKTKGTAMRVLVMAREGLDMMKGVTDVVEGTLLSADEWCERFGKGKDTAEKEDPEKQEGQKMVSWNGEAEKNNDEKSPEQMDIEVSEQEGIAKAG